VKPPALPPALDGERQQFGGRAGAITVYRAGAGPPLLLVHSVNAAASAAEVRPLFEHYRATRSVYAPDLPGYGLSERSDRPYTPRLMTDALHETVAQIRQRHGALPVDALAVSLGCEFLARAAVEQPAHFRRLALVSPTGFSGAKRRYGPAGGAVGPPWVKRVVVGPGWGAPLFRGLTTPGVIRYFLRRTWGAQDIDEALWAYDVLTTRQPGAEHAPLAFLSAALFSSDINALYEQLTQPVWMSHGVRGDFVDYRGKTTVQGRPNWHFTVFQTGAMPYFEQPAAFMAACDEFLGAAA
jgi:pimeloyl-ACP methyl ester carboxylesterase